MPLVRHGALFIGISTNADQTDIRDCVFFHGLLCRVIRKVSKDGLGAIV